MENSFSNPNAKGSGSGLGSNSNEFKNPNTKGAGKGIGGTDSNDFGKAYGGGSNALGIKGHGDNTGAPSPNTTRPRN